MKSENNIWKLLASLFALVIISACTHIEVPDVKVYKEIPFVDAPEAIYVKTVAKEEGTVSAEEWKQISPYLVCLDDEGWAKVKKSWRSACRMVKSDGGECNIILDSVETLVRRLDEITKTVIKP